MNVSELSILSVDDEPDLVELSKEILESLYGMRVQTTTSVQEALGLIKDVRFDAIVSDYQMPGMDGIDFLKKLRSEKDQTPFILFTGRGREEVVVQAIDSGADAYVQKGTDIRSAFAELAHKIRNSVVRFRAERAMEESEVRYRSMIDGSPMMARAMATRCCSPPLMASGLWRRRSARPSRSSRLSNSDWPSSSLSPPSARTGSKTLSWAVSVGMRLNA
jgi:CheY-like chemotaxis protein